MKSCRRGIFLKLLLISFLSCFAYYQVAGQTDTEFWFVAPHAIWHHGKDSTAKFYFTSYDTTNTTYVKIYKHADPSSIWFPMNVTVPPGSTVSVDLSIVTDILVNNLADTVLDRGFHITSTRMITAFYKVVNRLNPEIFVLKGDNSLGKAFFVPGQYFYNNATNYGPPTNHDTAYNAFDIVATEDNTIVTITPSQDFYNNHSAGTDTVIILDKGQTYSARAATYEAASHLSVQLNQ